MIVIDASAMTEFLLQTALGSRVEARLFRDGDECHSPHLLDVEVAQALRRLVRTRDVLAERAQEALDDLADFDVRRHPHVHFLGRAWELRGTTSRRTMRCTWHSPKRSMRLWLRVMVPLRLRPGTRYGSK